jgi:hypothetical protein
MWHTLISLGLVCHNKGLDCIVVGVYLNIVVGVYLNTMKTFIDQRNQIWF